MQIMTPQEYFNKINPRRNPEEIKAICEELTNALFNPSDKPKTRINKLTPYNKLIRAIPDSELVEGENAYIQTKMDGTLWKRHLHFKYTGLQDTQWYGENGINAKTVVLDRLENRREVKVGQYLETTCKLLLSNDPHELAVGLIAASGRRPVEILARGSFKLATDLPEYLKPGYFLTFKGQAKKRDYDIPLEERLEYRIGVLVPAEFFLAAFKRFRLLPSTKELLDLLKTETKKGTDPEIINDMIQSRRITSLLRVVKREFANFLPARFGETEVNNKSLRAVYVRLITDRDCPKNIADMLWASRAVGHFVDEKNPDDSQLRHLLTTLGYSDYYAEEEVPFMSAPQKPKPEKSVAARVSASDFESLKKLQSKWNLANQQAVVHRLLKSLEETENLKQQLLEAQVKITQLQQEKQQMRSVPQQPPQGVPHEKDLQTLVRQLIASELQKILPQVQQEQGQQLKAVETPQPQRQTKAKPQTPEIDWESVPSEELKTSKSRGAAEEKIRRSFLAITSYNDAQPSNSDRWVINNQALRQLSGCNGMLVKDWMERHQLAIDDHNNKYVLGQYHNKGRGDITQVISW